jgi:tRNA A37 threonylcarbamoyladenosine synthetase subunit TsaC/SUA5/YrdC
MIELAKYCNEPIALTSANISNEPSSLSIKVKMFCNNKIILK